MYKNLNKLQKKYITDKKGVRRIVWVKPIDNLKAKFKRGANKQSFNRRGGSVVIHKEKELDLPRKDGEKKSTEFKEAYSIAYANKSQIPEVKSDLKKIGLIYHHDNVKKLLGYAFPKSEQKVLAVEVDVQKLD